MQGCSPVGVCRGPSTSSRGCSSLKLCISAFKVMHQWNTSNWMGEPTPSWLNWDQAGKLKRKRSQWKSKERREKHKEQKQGMNWPASKKKNKKRVAKNVKRQGTKQSKTLGMVPTYVCCSKVVALAPMLAAKWVANSPQPMKLQMLLTLHLSKG